MSFEKMMFIAYVQFLSLVESMLRHIEAISGGPVIIETLLAVSHESLYSDTKVMNYLAIVLTLQHSVSHLSCVCNG